MILISTYTIKIILGKKSEMTKTERERRREEREREREFLKLAECQG